MVPIQFSTLVEKMLVSGEGALLNTLILVPHIDVETGAEMQVALNSQHIVIIEELNITMKSNIPLVFRKEKINKDLG